MVIWFVVRYLHTYIRDGFRLNQKDRNVKRLAFLFGWFFLLSCGFEGGGLSRLFLLMEWSGDGLGVWSVCLSVLSGRMYLGRDRGKEWGRGWVGYYSICLQSLPDQLCVCVWSHVTLGLGIHVPAKALSQYNSLLQTRIIMGQVVTNPLSGLKMRAGNVLYTISEGLEAHPEV